MTLEFCEALKAQLKAAGPLEPAETQQHLSDCPVCKLNIQNLWKKISDEVDALADNNAADS